MAAFLRTSARTGWAGLLLAGAVTAAPASAASAPKARLVHCGEQTCLRLSGHRSSRAVAIKVGEQPLAVQGGRSWRVTVPLETARRWPGASGPMLTLALIDRRTGSESTDRVELPPGALGRQVELATLMVYPR